jgi:hypothetical protein
MAPQQPLSSRYYLCGSNLFLSLKYHFHWWSMPCWFDVFFVTCTRRVRDQCYAVVDWLIVWLGNSCLHSFCRGYVQGNGAVTKRCLGGDTTYRGKELERLEKAKDAAMFSIVFCAYYIIISHGWMDHLFYHPVPFVNKRVMNIWTWGYNKFCSVNGRASLSMYYIRRKHPLLWTCFQWLKTFYSVSPF